MPSIYIGGTKIRNIYSGTNKIKKIYHGTTLVYTTQIIRGVATALSRARRDARSASVGNYVLFGGGTVTGSSNTQTNAIDSYDTSLIRGTPASIDYMARHGGASNSNYAMFAAGTSYDEGTVNLTSVYAYSSSLVQSLSSTSNSGAVDGSCSSPTKAMFAMKDKLDYFNTSLVRGSVSTGDYYHFQSATLALSGSGVYVISPIYSTVSSRPSAYNVATMVRTPLSSLASNISFMFGLTIGDYAIYTASSPAGYIYAYNNSLVLTIPHTNAIQRNSSCVGTVFGGYAMIIGGNVTTTETLDTNLILSSTQVPAISEIKTSPPAVGNIKDSYALIAGGMVNSATVSTVEYYGY